MQLNEMPSSLTLVKAMDAEIAKLTTNIPKNIDRVVPKIQLKASKDV